MYSSLPGLDSSPGSRFEPLGGRFQPLPAPRAQIPACRAQIPASRAQIPTSRVQILAPRAQIPTSPASREQIPASPGAPGPDHSYTRRRTLTSLRPSRDPSPGVCVLGGNFEGFVENRSFKRIWPHTFFKQGCGRAMCVQNSDSQFGLVAK